MANK
ncbi:hypothetical protein YPPY101_4219, partial [Yersinia pestis PY-101]|jgi:hypothetical protein